MLRDLAQLFLGRLSREVKFTTLVNITTMKGNIDLHLTIYFKLVIFVERALANNRINMTLHASSLH